MPQREATLAIPDESTAVSIHESMHAIFLAPSEVPLDVRTQSVTPERPATFDLPLVEDACLSVVAELDGPPTGQPLTLRIVNPLGEAVWTDERNDGVAALSHWCPPQAPAPAAPSDVSGGDDAPAARYTLQAESAIAGTLRVTKRWETPNAETRALSELAQRWLPGFRPLGPPQRYLLAPNQRAELPFAVRSDACYGLIAVGEPSVEDLDLRLLTLDGEQLALEVSTEPRAFVGPICPVHDGVVRVEFRMYAGSGGFRWQLFDIDRETGRALLERRAASADGRRGW